MSSGTVFFFHTDYIQQIASGLGGTLTHCPIVILFVGVQGAIEAVVCTHILKEVLFPGALGSRD